MQSRVAVFTGLVLLPLTLHPQAPGTGAIRGTVLDPSGRSVSNASVVIENKATHAQRTAYTSTSGEYGVAMLAPGSYSATAEAQGFANARAESVTVVVSETSTVDFHLAIAATATVEVVARQDIVDTESSTLGRAVDEEAIRVTAIGESQLYADPFAFPRRAGGVAGCDSVGARHSERDCRWRKNHGKQHTVQRRGRQQPRTKFSNERPGGGRSCGACSGYHSGIQGTNGQLRRNVRSRNGRKRRCG